MGTQLIDPRLAHAMRGLLAKHPDLVGSRELLEVLAKVAPTAGARATDLTPLAQAMTKPLGQRLREAAAYVISGITPLTYFSPEQPLRPYAQDDAQGAKGRRYDFQVGQNIQFLPKTEAGAGVPFQVLRALRDSYDLLALVIETRKDQVCAYEWEIVPVEEGKTKDDFQDQVQRAEDFFTRPTPEHDWLEWLRVIVDEHLVCDGVALYPRLNRGGTLHSLYPLDVALVKRLIDEHGLMPLAPAPAFQQILKGVPAVDYLALQPGDPLRAEGDQLLYWLRNPRANRIYGFSPVEQVITTINIAMRRQEYQLRYYTDGNVPDMLLGVPESWTPEQIEEFQDQFDSMLQGNLASRRRAHFMPELKVVHNMKDAQVTLTDMADEWFSRIICFAFSISPSALTKQVNRASGEQMQETAKEEGLLPLLRWLAAKFTQVTQGPLGCPDVKFAWKFAVEVDPAQQATTNTAYVKVGVLTVNEAREAIGKEPLDGGDDLIVETASGPVPLKESVERARQNALNPPPPPPVAVHGAPPPGGQPPGSGPGGSPEDAKKIVDLTLALMKRDARPVHVHVAPPDVLVNVEPAVVHVDQRTGAELPASVTKTTRARRDPATGDLVGETTETYQARPPGSEASEFVKTVKVERRQA